MVGKEKPKVTAGTFFEIHEFRKVSEFLLFGKTAKERATGSWGTRRPDARLTREELSAAQSHFFPLPFFDRAPITIIKPMAIAARISITITRNTNPLLATIPCHRHRCI